MRIALFTETFLPKIDGVSHTLCRLLSHLESLGHECLLFAPSGAPPAFGKTPIVGIPGMVLPFYRELKLLSPIFPVVRHLRRFQPDVIHLVNPFSLGLPGLWAGYRLKVPVVSSYHTDLPGFIEKWGHRRIAGCIGAYLRAIHNRTAITLCPSQATRRDLEKKGFHRVGVWSRGVDRKHFCPEHRSEAIRFRLSGGEPEKPLLLYVGRLSKEKQVDHLVAVMRSVKGARLAIVGDGPHREALEKNLTDAVFTGYLTGADLAGAYASADLFVFPSENDTFGNVVLEAMASGLPVVAARAGGPVDMVRHDENGFLYAPGDVRGFINCVQQVVDDPALRSRLSDGALAEAARRTWPAVLDGLVTVYAHCAHSCARPVLRSDPFLKNQEAL